MVRTHTIETLSFNNQMLHIIIDGQTLNIPLQNLSNKLLLATDIERNLFTISPSGYGIHWPLLDEDISIEALLKSL
ncbi:MAG: DUF2442 domain-containing protein [Bacteroidetes bacterium]|jgi:hypothetical protein|nr:DUF2442 domain-containing protein [Bacteroidota bacterium]